MTNQFTPAERAKAPAAEPLSDARLAQMKEQLLVSDAVVGELIDADDVRGLIARAEKAEAQLTDQAEAERQLLLRDEENRKLTEANATLRKEAVGMRNELSELNKFKANQLWLNGMRQQYADNLPAPALPEAAAQSDEACARCGQACSAECEEDGRWYDGPLVECPCCKGEGANLMRCDACENTGKIPAADLGPEAAAQGKEGNGG